MTSTICLVIAGLALLNAALLAHGRRALKTAVFTKGHVSRRAKPVARIHVQF